MKRLCFIKRATPVFLMLCKLMRQLQAYLSSFFTSSQSACSCNFSSSCCACTRNTGMGGWGWGGEKRSESRKKRVHKHQSKWSSFLLMEKRAVFSRPSSTSPCHFPFGESCPPQYHHHPVLYRLNKKHQMTPYRPEDSSPYNCIFMFKLDFISIYFICCTDVNLVLSDSQSGSDVVCMLEY